MKVIDLIASFELEINRLDDTANKPVTDDSIYWINQAANKFEKERFNGNAPHYTSYEQNEKRTNDLVRLYKTSTATTTQAGTDETQVNYVQTVDTNPSYTVYEFAYPNDLQYVLSEDVTISDNNGGHSMNTCVFECTTDSLMYRINNKLTDFHYKFHKARPLRIRTDKGANLFTDKNYRISSYTVTYLRRPTEITSDATKDFTDFDDSTWYEIIKIAAQMYIENKSDQRYKTITGEVLTQE